MQNIIVKFDEKNNPLGRLTFYGFFQDQIGSQRSTLKRIKILIQIKALAYPMNQYLIIPNLKFQLKAIK